VYRLDRDLEIKFSFEESTVVFVDDFFKRRTQAVDSYSGSVCHTSRSRYLTDARFPPLRCRSSVAVSPFPLAVAVSVHRCRCRYRYTYALACRRRWLAGQILNGTTEKVELDPISTEERLRQLFAFALGCNGTPWTEFSYVIFTEQRNFTTAERRNGNGRTATEWWKPGMTLASVPRRSVKISKHHAVTLYRYPWVITAGRRAVCGSRDDSWVLCMKDSTGSSGDSVIDNKSSIHGSLGLRTATTCTESSLRCSLDVETTWRNLCAREFSRTWQLGGVDLRVWVRPGKPRVCKRPK